MSTFDLQSIVGMKQGEACDAIIKAGFGYVVVIKDGEPMFMNYLPCETTADLVVENGVVTQANFGDCELRTALGQIFHHSEATEKIRDIVRKALGWKKIQA